MAPGSPFPVSPQEASVAAALAKPSAARAGLDFSPITFRHGLQPKPERNLFFNT